MISSICTWSIMTTPRYLDKKKITLWPGREISALLTSIAVDILGSDRSCIKTAVPVLTAHCNVVLVVLWLPMVSWLLTPVGPGGRQRERRGPLQDSNTILCCPTHWVSHTRRTTEHNTTDKIAHIFFPNPPDLMLGLWCSGVQLARHFHFSISWRKINNSQHRVKSSYYNRGVTAWYWRHCQYVSWYLYWYWYWCWSLLGNVTSHLGSTKTSIST